MYNYEKKLIMEETKLQTLIINQLTREQYDSITPEEDQIYLITDDKTVDEQIEEHNNSSSSHSDIRNSISETIINLTGQINNLNETLRSLIDTKQDTLIAGNNINIENNIISADKGADVIVRDWRK